MIYWDLLVGLLKVGCFAFGGGYGAVPLIREVVLSYGWLSEETLAYMIAISESTPGPIMVNMATYIGNSQAGFLGALIATIAVVLPAFFIILLVMVLLKTALKNPWVQAVMQGLKPCIIGIILATGVYMIVTNCVPAQKLDFRALIIMLLLALIQLGSKRILKRQISSITFIVISACMGIVVYGL